MDPNVTSRWADTAGVKPSGVWAAARVARTASPAKEKKRIVRGIGYVGQPGGNVVVGSRSGAMWGPLTSHAFAQKVSSPSWF